MGTLVLGEFEQVRVKRVRKTRGEEVGVGVVCDSGAVEGGFEVFEGESVVQNCYYCRKGGLAGVGERGGTRGGEEKMRKKG